MSFSRPELSSAVHILRDCLHLTNDQSLVIILDETTVDVAAVLAEAADLEGIAYDAFLIPVSVQKRIPTRTDLSLTVQSAAQDAHAILTCVTANPDCLAYRNRILETTWSARTRIGHMPGATLEVLKLANVDMVQLVKDCHLVEEVLARGRRLVLCSTTVGEETHTLTVDIGSWLRLPVASDGIISDGVWGNVPSGETYIAPIEGSAEGSVVINGSVPGMVVPAGSELILHFHHGALTHYSPPDNPVAEWLEKTQFSRVRSSGNLNWANLAEIGIGVNPGVEKLTGNMLLDEKAAGTVHIAIGDNTFMGGMIKADIHCDMVVRTPTVAIDGIRIVNLGKLVRDFTRTHHEDVELAQSPIPQARTVARSGTEAILTATGLLQRKLHNEPGRISTCQVGSNETAQLAGVLYRQLPVNSDGLSPIELAARTRLPIATVWKLLHILSEYELITCQ